MTEAITEYRNENTKDIDLLSTIDMVRKMNEEDQIVAKVVGDEAANIATGIDIIAKAFLKGGRLFYFGAGTSGRLGILDASECPPTFSVEPTMVQGIIAGGQNAILHAAEGAEDSFDAGKKDANVLMIKMFVLLFLQAEIQNIYWEFWKEQTKLELRQLLLLVTLEGILQKKQVM